MSDLFEPAVAPEAHVTQAEFARLQGWSKSYVTKLKGEGRLVLNEAGLVDVEASLARIRDTTGAPERASAPAVTKEFDASRDRKAHYDAELARLQYEREVGGVLKTDEVLSVVADVATQLRASFEAWPSRLAPQIVALGGDEQRIQALLADTIERHFAALSSGFARMTEGRT
jgi:hypothetical protein